jgi:hypothetical protein
VSSSSASHNCPFELERKTPSRRVSFKVLRNLLAYLGRTKETTYSTIVEKPPAEVGHILVTDAGKPMGRSTRYHHFNALKLLGLVRKRGDFYALSQVGSEIAASYHGDNVPLEAETLKRFRVAVQSCDLVRRNFFILFTGDPSLDFLKHGAPVGFYPIPGEGVYELRCMSWDGNLRLSREQTTGIMWGIRLWCLEVGLIDEIFIRPQAEVSTEMANIIFPVDVEAAQRLTLEAFGELLFRYLPHEHPVYGDTVSMSIPLLLYRLCPAERLPVHRAKSLLKEWLTLHQEWAFVESPSYSVLESGRARRGSSRVVWRKQQQVFLDVGGKLYSRLFASRAIWKSGGMYHASR